MITSLAIIAAVGCLGLLIAVLFSNKTLERQIAEEKRETKRLREYHESEISRIYNEAQAAVAESQKLIDRQSSDLKHELDRVRGHYQAEARKIQDAANTTFSKMRKELEPLRKYQGLHDAEIEVQRQLAAALKEAGTLRTEAQNLLDQAKNAAADERATATEKAREIRDQAAARLNQALHDAGRIVAEAEKRAQQIAGDAYTALRDKQMLEKAAVAMRNVIEGYGDRYLIPTHSVLDDFAEKFGYDEAGQALKSAREQSRRMIEQGEAATCDYAEIARRKTAIQFVIHAFNGSVDSILTRVIKNENYGTLEQQIRDVFSIVNKDGSAFRDARILPAYLDARLAELKWAFKVQELAIRLRDEQRAERERIRDEEKAKEKLLAAARDTELQRVAVDEAEARFARATAELKMQHEQQLAEARQKGSSAVEEAEKRHIQEIADLNAVNEQRLEEERKKLAEATKRELTIAQQTRQGHIYIISNEGSFGANIHKIGFTRREVEERVDELYEASVPFEFDIHAVITTDNAPELEYEIHRKFLAKRMNKKNFHKEFFCVSLEEIRQEVEKLTQNKDFNVTLKWREMEAGRVAEWQESRRIENDVHERDQWLKREQASADEKRQKRLRRLARGRTTLGTPSSSGPESDEVVGQEI